MTIMTIRPTRRVTAAALTVTALAAGLLATAAPASAATGGLTNSCTGTLTATVTGADPLTEYRVYVDFTAGLSLAASDVSDAGGAISPMTVNVPSNLDVDVYLTSTPDGEMARVALACAVPASVTGMSSTITIGTITDSSSPATTTSQYTNMLATYTWTAPPATRMPLTGYLVSYMDHNGALAGPGNGGTPLAAGATSFTSTRADRAAAGLSPLQPFSVRVSAVNANGSGAPSQARVAIMPGANPAGTPWLDTVHAPPTLHTLATSELDISGEFALLDDPAWLTPLTGVELFYIHEGDAGTADVAQSGTPLMSTADAVSLGVFPAAGNSANVPFSATLPAAGSYRLYWQGIAGAARSTIFPSSRNTPPQVTATLPVPDPVVLTSTLSSVSACPSEADSALMTACYDNVAQTLSWPTPSDNGVAISGYEVESTVDGVTWAPRAGLPAGTNSLIVDQAYRQAAGITAVQSYRVRLRAVNASGAGSWGTNGMGAYCPTGSFTAGPCAFSTLSRSGDGTTATITAKMIIAPSYPVVDTIEYGYRPTAALPAATVVAGTAPVVGVAPVTATFALPDPSVTYVITVRGVAAGIPGPWQDGTFAGYVPPGAPGGGSGSGSGGGDSTPSTSTTPGTSATQSAPDTTATPTASPDDLSAWVVGARMATGFKKRSGILRPKAKKNIDSFIESLSPGMTIGVYGFSPSTSNTTAANASRLRANRVAAYLRAHGVPVVHVSKGLSRKDARIAFGPGSRIQHNRTVVMLGLTPLPVTEQAPLPTDPDLELPGTARHLEDGKPLDTQTNPGSDAGGDVAGEIASVAPNYRLGVAFAHGSATLNSKSIRAGFAEFVAHAKEAGLSGPVAVYGHAGAYECKTEAACTRLSQKRASALAAELRDMGIRIARVDVVGWGQMPVATSLGQTTPHNRAAVMTAAVTWPTDSVAPALIRAAQSTKELS